MKEIPDFDIELSQAMDYIMGSDLAGKAFDDPPFSQYTNVLRLLVQDVDRLADNCHMPEFTNHALPHICSVVRRASEWGVSAGWLELLSGQEAGFLLLALVIHDIGMLSQDAQDLPQKDRLSNMKGFSDISNWVRRTHVIRLENLIKRLLKEADGSVNWNNLEDEMQVVIGMAASHQSWEWEKNFISHRKSIRALGLSEEKIAALNAIIAVCDLLDEDANRCDTITLIKYKHGTMENMAHWMRHALTVEVDGVRNHTVTVTFRKLLPSEKKHEKIYRALRNHYRLVKLYNNRLQTIGAQIDNIVFQPMDGLPELVDEVSVELQKIWVNLPEFEDYVVEQLLSTFMPEALNQDNGDKKMRKRLDALGLETIDLSQETFFIEPETVYFSDERILFEKKAFHNRLKYIKQQVDAAYLDRNIGKVRHLCRIVLQDWKEEVLLQDIYWLFVYLIVFQKNIYELYEVERVYENQLEARRRTENRNNHKLKTEGAYQPLLDVLFCLQDLCTGAEWYAKYREHIKNGSYDKLVCDDATELLLETIVGLLWYYDSAENDWAEIADELIRRIPDDLSTKLREYKTRLKKQTKIIYHADNKELNSMRKNSFDPLEKAWIDFWQEDWKKQKENIPDMSRMGNRDPDYREAIQAYFNLVRRDIRLYEEFEDLGSEKPEETPKDSPPELLAGENDQKIKPMMVEPPEEDNRLDDTDEESEFEERECEIGVFRFQRIVSEQRLSIFEEQRNSCMEQILLKCMRKPNNSQNERIGLLSLLALRTLNALRYWNLWQYIETIRFQTRIEYMNGVYLDEDGAYCGDKHALTDCCKHYIQGLNREELTEEERKKLIYFMETYNKEGIDDIVDFITKKSVPIQWPFAIKLVDAFAPHISGQHINELLPWLIRYDKAYKGQFRYINTKQYVFLQYWFDKIREDDWENIKILIAPVFNHQTSMISNEKMISVFWNYAPWNLCMHYLEKMKEFPDNVRKSWQIYSAVISLSQRKNKNVNDLHIFMNEIEADLNRKINQKQCKDDFKEHASDMKRNYEEVQKLIDVENLSQLEPVDLTMIRKVLDEMEHHIEKMGSLGSYDRALINPVREAFTNKNWKVDDIEQEKQIADRIFNVINKYRTKQIFVWYYRDFCDLLVAMENTGSDEICEYINRLAIQNLLRSDFREETDEYGKDGPYQTFRFQVKTKNEYYIAVILLLVSGVTEIQRKNIPEVIEYTLSALQTDEPVLYNYAMVIFSYFYLQEEGEKESISLAAEGLQFIAGRLLAGKRYVAEKKEDSITEYVRLAINAMQESEKWFGKHGFKQKAESNLAYKRMFAAFF